jgi:hypothetical protein
LIDAANQKGWVVISMKNDWKSIFIIYKFKVRGMGALGYGVQKLSAVGHVYHLNDIADFPGKYSEARAGLTVAKGVGALYIRNDKGVAIELRVHAEGVALSVGVTGVSIEME